MKITGILIPQPLFGNTLHGWPMNILMVTNTFTPHVGGVAKSVAAFTETYRQLGHRVLVIAPEFENMPENETDVIRVPAIQNFNGSDFSMRLPIPGYVFASLDEFRPDIVHSHHPFLLGDTALLVAASFDVPWCLPITPCMNSTPIMYRWILPSSNGSWFSYPPDTPTSATG